MINQVIPSSLINEKTRRIINGTGRFVLGGPHADAGLTGRKIIVDTYGGMGRHGGGAFSGKDPSKVDRSAAYASRWAAKHVVASGMAEKCEIQLAYAIGVSDPVSVFVNTMGSGAVADQELAKRVNEAFDKPSSRNFHLGQSTHLLLQEVTSASMGKTENSLGRGLTKKK